MLNWIRFSNIKISFDLNPFVWSFKWMFQGPTQSDPHLRMQYIRILGVSFLFVFDNGEYKIWEDDLVPTETKADIL